MLPRKKHSMVNFYKRSGESGYYMNAYGRWMFWSISRQDITILGVSAETASLFPV